MMSAREEHERQDAARHPSAEQTLRGRTIVTTRAEEKGLVLKKALRDRGARVLAIPCIRFVAPQDRGPLLEAIRQLERYDWILFTSAHAVVQFFDAVADSGRGPVEWSRYRFGVVGPSTASQVASTGVRIEGITVAPTAAALASTLLGSDPRTALGPANRCLLPQASIARADLEETLRAAQVPVHTVIAYRTVPEEPARAEPFLNALRAGERIDAIAFASPSAVDGFLGMTAPEGERAIRHRGIAVISIGPTTTMEIERRGLEVAAEAEPHTSEGLVAALVRRLAPEAAPLEASESDGQDAGAEGPGDPDARGG